MPIHAITFDAYGTLVRSDLRVIPERIVADHGLTASIEDVLAAWSGLYQEATQLTPFRTLREIEVEIMPRVLQRFELSCDATPYIDLFFELTTRVELYPEALGVLNALDPTRAAVVSNADEEQVAAWSFTLPVEFILLSEGGRAYKPDHLIFQPALKQLGLEPHEVLHVGDSDVDDVRGAKAAGLRVAWVNRDGRRRRPDVPEPDFEIPDLTGLLRLL